MSFHSRFVNKSYLCEQHEIKIAIHKQHEITSLSMAPRRRIGPAFLQHKITPSTVASSRRRGPAYLYLTPTPPQHCRLLRLRGAGVGRRVQQLHDGIDVGIVGIRIGKGQRGGGGVRYHTLKWDTQLDNYQSSVVNEKEVGLKMMILF